MANNIKPYSEGQYEMTQWNNGDIIVKSKMMHIEEWLASATDELYFSRTGKNLIGDNNSWPTLGDRLDYLSRAISLLSPDGFGETIDFLEEKIEEIQDSVNSANSAAALIENMVITTQTLAAGVEASAVDWQVADNRYELTLGIPVPLFSTTTTTTYDGSTEANVTIDNSDSLNRNLGFSIPVPKFNINTTTVTTGNINASVTSTDLNTLNPKLTFNIPVQKITGVSYEQMAPGTAGYFSIQNENTLAPSLRMGIPVQKISQVSASALPAGQNPTASLESIDNLNLRLNLGLPIAKPIDVVKTYSSVSALQSNIKNDVAVGYYAIVASNEDDEDNGKLYIRTSNSPYYSFIADIAAATPQFKIGDVNIVDVTGTKSASIDVTDPTQPELNLTIPAVPVFNSTVNTTTLTPGSSAAASISRSGTDKKLTLNLSIPQGSVGATPNLTIGTVTTGAAESSAAATITGTKENPVLNLTIPRGNSGSIDNLPIASPFELGAIKIGTGLNIASDGTLSTAVISTATTSSQGIVQVGSSLTIDSSNGILNVPTATTSNQGVIRVGSGLSISSGTLSIPTDAVPTQDSTKFLTSGSIYAMKNSLDSTISGIQSNVSSLQTTTSGLSGRLTTAEGNITTLTNNYNTISGYVNTNTNNISTNSSAITALQNNKSNYAITVDFGTISSLPVTINNSDITDDMTVDNWEMGSPWAFTSNLTVTTTSGSVTVSGTISNSSTLKIKLSNNKNISGS